MHGELIPAEEREGSYDKSQVKVFRQRTADRIEPVVPCPWLELLEKMFIGGKSRWTLEIPPDPVSPGVVSPSSNPRTDPPSGGLAINTTHTVYPFRSPVSTGSESTFINSVRHSLRVASPHCVLSNSLGFEINSSQPPSSLLSTGSQSSISSKSTVVNSPSHTQNMRPNQQNSGQFAEQVACSPHCRFMG